VLVLSCMKIVYKFIKAKKRPSLYSKPSIEMVFSYWIVSNCKITKMVFAFDTRSFYYKISYKNFMDMIHIK